MGISMTCVDKDEKGSVWTLDLGADEVVLRDAAGRPAARIPVGEAGGRLVLPSFSENVKYFAVPVGDQFRRFSVPRQGLKEIRAYVNRQTAAAGPEAVTAVRNAAIRDALIGIAAAVGGVVLTTLSYMHPIAQPGGSKFKVAYGLVLFGLVMICKGVYGYLRYNQIKAMVSS